MNPHENVCIPVEMVLAPTSEEQLHRLNVVAEAIFIQGEGEISTIQAVEKAALKLGWTRFLTQMPETSPWIKILFYRVWWNQPGPSVRQSAEFCIGYAERYAGTWTEFHGFDAVLTEWFAPLTPQRAEVEE